MPEKMDELEELDLSVRAFRNLKRSGIDTIDQLIELTGKKNWGQLIPNSGNAMICEIAQKLEEEELADFSSTVRNSGFNEKTVGVFRDKNYGM